MLAARQTGHVWGSIGSLFTPGLLWLLVDWPFALWLARAHVARRGDRGAVASRRVDRGRRTAAVLSLAALSLSVPRVLASTPLDQMFRARSVVEQLGPFGYHAYDTWNYARSTWLRPPATDGASRRRASAWLRERAPLRAGGTGVRRRARQEPDRRPGRVAAGFRRRFHASAARR